jgi:hypothetical protein
VVAEVNLPKDAVLREQIAEQSKKLVARLGFDPLDMVYCMTNGDRKGVELPPNAKLGPTHCCEEQGITLAFQCEGKFFNPVSWGSALIHAQDAAFDIAIFKAKGEQRYIIQLGPFHTGLRGLLSGKQLLDWLKKMDGTIIPCPDFPEPENTDEDLHSVELTDEQSPEAWGRMIRGYIFDCCRIAPNGVDVLAECKAGAQEYLATVPMKEPPVTESTAPPA